jgi:ribonuclease P/MRP protein subunit RPP1
MLVDLNVVYDDKEGKDIANARLVKTLVVAQELGFTGVAVNIIVQGKLKTGFSCPVNKDEIKKQFPRLAVWTRVTVVLDDVSQNQSFAHLYNTFDIISVRPMTEKAFQSAASALEVDIISFDMTQRLPFYLRHKTAGAAVERGVKFEISYAAAVTSVNARRHTIANAAAIIRACRSRGIIISSEAKSGLYLRGPHDAVNLAVLWGLDHMRAHDALARTPILVVKSARLRSCSYKQVIGIPDEAASVDSPEEPMKKKLKT